MTASSKEAVRRLSSPEQAQVQAGGANIHCRGFRSMREMVFYTAGDDVLVGCVSQRRYILACCRAHVSGTEVRFVFNLMILK